MTKISGSCSNLRASAVMAAWRHSMPADSILDVPQRTPPPSERWPGLARWAPIAIVLAVGLAYADALNGEFVLDDITSIRENPTILRLWPIWTALSAPAGKGLTPNGRPLVNLSLAVNHAVSGFSTWSYHGFNILIHGQSALALYGLVRRTLQLMEQTRLGSLPAATPFATAVALLWAVHPLLTEAVTYVVQRAESMMGLFYLATLYGFARQVQQERSGQGAGCWPAVCIGCCLAGMGCKEVMVSAPLVVLLYDRTFASGSFQEAWRRHRTLYLGLGATWLLLAYEVAITGNRGGTAGIGTHVEWWRYALTQGPAILNYLRLAVWPHPLIFDYGIGLSRNLLRALPGDLFVASLIAATIWALVRRPVAGFLGAAFFAILAPSSSVVPVATEVMAEHRMYLPMTTFVVASVAALAWLLRGRPWAGTAATAATASAALALGAATFVRNLDYAGNIPLWTTVVDRYPANMRGHYNLGCSYDVAGEPNAAVAQYRIVPQGAADYLGAQENLGKDLVKLGKTEESLVPFEIVSHANPDKADLQCSLGIALLATGRPEPAVEHLKAALKLDPTLDEATYQMGEAYLRLGRAQDAIACLREAAKARPNSAETFNALGNALLQAGQPSQAEAAYRNAIGLDSHLVEPHNNLANLLLENGRTLEAAKEFQEAIALKPTFAELHNNLGDAMLSLGRLDNAISELSEAVRLNPASVDARYNLGNALAETNHLDESIVAYREALRLMPGHVKAHNNLGIALAKLGRLDEAREEFLAALRLQPDFAEARENLEKIERYERSNP